MALFGFGKKTATSGSSSNSNGLAPANERLPWQKSDNYGACNYAFGLLVEHTVKRCMIDGRLHAETYIATAGAIAGYSAQCSLFAENPHPEINLLELEGGKKFYFGDPLNFMLVTRDPSKYNACLWNLAAAMVVDQGVPEKSLPTFEKMFGHVSSVMHLSEIRPSTKEQPFVGFLELLKFGWPVAEASFSGSAFKEISPELRSAKRIWWSAIAANAAQQALVKTKDVLPPAVALQIIMESAICCSKVPNIQTL
jgi:hypothetical protein